MLPKLALAGLLLILPTVWVGSVIEDRVAVGLLALAAFGVLVVYLWMKVE